MKKNTYVYWATTGLIAALMLWSAYNFAFSEQQRDAFRHLGLPGWFRWELTVAKALGALALLIPAVPARVKEFAYFGFGLTIVSADIAHLSSGDSPWFIAAHLTFFGILLVSYLQYHALGRERVGGATAGVSPA
jgi:DoxX-like family